MYCYTAAFTKRSVRIVKLSVLLTPLTLAICLLSACALLEGSQARPTPTPVTVTVVGSTEMRPLLIELTAAYSERNPHLQFILRGGGSRLGEQWLASGRADIAASAAVYPDAELPADLVRIPIGLDGIALIVHNDNPVDALTLAQIRDLYRGRTLKWEDIQRDRRPTPAAQLNWKDVGGGEVLLVSREEGSATRAFFEERVMGTDQVSWTAVVMPTSSDVVEYVASHRAAIGYVTSAYLSRTGESAEEKRESGPLPAAIARAVKAVSVEGRLPYGADLVDHQYPLARPLYLFIRQSGEPALEDIVNFALGAEGQSIVARYHTPIR